MKNPLVSIIIPVYNEEKYLNTCLSSLSKQSYSNNEIIIVDDGSNDDSLKICKKYKVKILKQNHKGPGTARNLGAKYAKGQILAFLDADMKYDKEYIEKLISPLLNTDAIGTFNKEFLANTDNIWAQCWAINSNLPPDRREPEDLPDTLGIFRAIKKETFINIQGFDPSYGYFDDGTLEPKLQKKSALAKGAIAYHYNPESLREVFLSSRWIGRGMQDKKNIVNFLRYLPFNSTRNALRKIIKGAPKSYLIFKLTYDAGMFAGIFLSFGKKAK